MKQQKATKLKTLQTSSYRSTIQTSTEQVLWKKGGIVQTQRDDKKCEKLKKFSSPFLQNKTEVSNLSIPHTPRINRGLLQHRFETTFTIASVFLLQWPQNFKSVIRFPQQRGMSTFHQSNI